MPFKSEHSALINSNDYKTYSRVNDKFGKGIDAVFGILKKKGPNGGSTELHSIRFKSKEWTSEKARKWLKDNGYKTKEFTKALINEDAAITSSSVGDAYAYRAKVGEPMKRPRFFMEEMENYLKESNDSLKQKMISKVKKENDSIYPAGDKKQLEDCFTVEGDELLFWYNDKSGSTHVMTANINSGIIK